MYGAHLVLDQFFGVNFVDGARSRTVIRRCCCKISLTLLQNLTRTSIWLLVAPFEHWHRFLHSFYPIDGYQRGSHSHFAMTKLAVFMADIRQAGTKHGSGSH